MAAMNRRSESRRLHIGESTGGQVDISANTKDHIVGTFWHWVYQLRLAAPRSMCGLTLLFDSRVDEPDGICEKCARLAGWKALS